MNCEYVREHYGVPASIGMRVTVNGKPGIIAEDMGHHIGVNFDSDKPGHISPAHPTWKVEYGEMGTIRKMTRSQARYRRYLSMDGFFDSFRDFLLWECLGGTGIEN